MLEHPIALHNASALGPGKIRRPYLEPIAAPKSNPPFAKPPGPLPASFLLPLASFAPNEAAKAETAGKLIFHAVGDTGGINGTETQEAVAQAMEAQIVGASGPVPAFFYHLGDVVYYDGQSGFYGSQFYSPYQYYPREIVAIPGNHDGDTRFRAPDPPPDGPTLAGFMKNFCDSHRESIYPYRLTMTQPYCWWVLDAPFVTILGLYSNIEGSLDPRGGSQQQQFLQTQLKAAPSNKFLIIAVHHPPYSLDSFHGGTPDIASAIDRAFNQTGRLPDLVLSGHVHSYQRFTRTLSAPGKGKKAQRTLPYVVAGAGGFANNAKSLHQLQTNPANGKPPANGTKCKSQVDPSLVLTIDGQNDQDASFLRVTATAAELQVEAFAVPFSGAPPAKPFDSVKIALQA